MEGTQGLELGEYIVVSKAVKLFSTGGLSDGHCYNC